MCLAVGQLVFPTGSWCLSGGRLTVNIEKSTAHLATVWVMAALPLIALAFCFWLLWKRYTGNPGFAAKWKAQT